MLLLRPGKLQMIIKSILKFANVRGSVRSSVCLSEHIICPSCMETTFPLPDFKTKDIFEILMSPRMF